MKHHQRHEMLLQASDWKSLNWQEPEEDHASISYGGGGDMTPTIKVPSSRGLVSECYRLGLSEPATNNSRQIFPSVPSAAPSSYNFTPTSQRPRPPAPPTSSLLAEVINYLIYSDSGGFLFVARYKTGIAVLSITRRRAREPHGPRSDREHKDGEGNRAELQRRRYILHIACAARRQARRRPTLPERLRPSLGSITQ